MNEVAKMMYSLIFNFLSIFYFANLLKNRSKNNYFFILIK